MTAEQPEITVDQTVDQLIAVREVRAPRSLVWQVFTQPAHLARWWGPTGFETRTHHQELRPGGGWDLTMHGPDGRDYPNRIVYLVVDPPGRLVFVHRGATDSDPELHTTAVTLTEVSPTHTRVELRMTFPTPQAKDDAIRTYGALDGVRQTFTRLGTLLDQLAGEAADGEVFQLRRVLRAPPELVWAAWTDAAHLLRWFHPSAWRLSSAALDLRVGGTFRYAMRGAESPDMLASWTFTRIDAPTTLAFRLAFCDEHGAPVRAPFESRWPLITSVTVTLEPHAGIGGGTVLTVASWPVEATEAEVELFRSASGSMAIGWGETLDALAEWLAERGGED